jgi:hypothetical protein
MDANRREIHREPAIELDPALDGFDELRDIAVARVETGVRVHDADDRAGEGVFAVAERFDEDFAEEEGEMGVAVGGEALAEAGLGG